jgi:CheY-like chemotaxis protein
MAPPVLTPSDNVLIVDDEQFSRVIVARFLRELGNPQITYAKDGSEALAALVTPGANYRMVISDFNMPVKNGLELLKIVRSSTGSIRYDIPFLMLTGLADQAVVGAALALDTDSFVVKPVSKVALEARILRALSEQRDLKTPQAYAEVDITAACAGLLSHEPVGTFDKNRAKKEATPANAQRLSLSSVKPGAVLADDIRAPNGELLLACGAVLSPRLLNRLRDLSSLKIPIDEIWVKL